MHQVTPKYMSTHEARVTTACRLGQRLSLKSHACTVRYIGTVEGKSGEWLGVEWDDAARGKNNGTHDGVQYFKCRSSSLTAASFIRPAQAWDKPRTFLEALADKYFKVEEATTDEVLFVSRSKQYEEVGFERFALRQAELRGIHVVVLDHMKIGPDLPEADVQAIEQTCAHITDLDLGSNLFEKLEDILELCSHVPKLNSLTLDGNRLQIDPGSIHTRQLSNIRALSLNDTLLDESGLCHLLQAFPAVEQLNLARNEITHWQAAALPRTLTTIDLAENCISDLQDIESILQLPQLRSIKLKDNRIERVCTSQHVLSATLTELDLGRNAISTWQPLDHLTAAFPALHSLRVSGIPIYSSLRSASGKPLTPEDCYMLTIARLPNVNMLNFSAIREKDRLNAEKYYLSEIASEIAQHDSKDAQHVIAQHPRWQALCEEYGEPQIDRAKRNDINSNSLEARLLTIDYYTNTALSGTLEVPRAWSIYALYGLLAKHLQLMPVKLKLTWQTDERDPVTADSHAGPQWWDSDDEDTTHDLAWTRRSVELKPGTRPIGTYCEVRRVTIRVDILR